MGYYIWYSEEGTGWGCGPAVALAVDGWAIIFGTMRRILGGAAALPALAVDEWALHLVHRGEDWVASLAITILLYNDPLLAGFNVPIQGLNHA